MEFIYLVLAAIGGGIFASIIGGTNAFIFTGITGLLGIISNMSGGGSDFLSSIPMGTLFGPHVAFNGGVTALALYKRLYDDKGIVNGKDTFMPLYQFKKPLVILAGGIMGSLGFIFNFFLVEKLALEGIDTVALTIVIFNIITRIIIGKTSLFPNKVDRSIKLMDFRKNLIFNFIWGLGLSFAIALVVITLNNELIGFYISAVSLILLSLGKPIPATHHITLVAGYAAIKFGNPFIASLFGAVATLLGEYIELTFNDKADTLIDMPSTVIAICSLIILGIF